MNLLNNTATKMDYGLKVEIYDDVTDISDSEKDVPSADSVKKIVSYIKYVLAEVYGSNFREQINSIQVKFQNECHRNSFLELFLQPPQNKSVQQNKIIRRKKCPVTNSHIRRKVKLFATLKSKDKGLKIIVKKKVVEKTPKQKEKTPNEALNKKISCFFPKLMTKIASKSDELVEKTLLNKQSLFIVSCTAYLAWKFKNIDAYCLFKLSAVEIERGNLSQAFIYYEQAKSSLSEMIFHDKIFSFLFNGKTESTIIEEIPHSEAKYFLYRQTNIALMLMIDNEMKDNTINDNTMFSFAFDETDHTKLNSTEIDGAKIKSINYYSLEDLEKVATRYTSNSNEKNKK